MISCCGLIAVTFGFVNTQGLFIDYIAEDLNVGRGVVSLYVTINFIVAAVLAPTLGSKLRDKYNIKIILIVSGLIMFAFYLLFPLFNNIYLFYLFGFVFGATTGIFGNTMVVPLLNEWFEKAGTPIGIALAFSGVFSAIYSPLAVSLIDKFGWRRAYYSYAVIFFIVIVYSIIVISNSSDEKRVVQIKEKSPLNKELFLVYGFYIGGSMITTIGNYMLSYALSIGLNSNQGSLLVSVVSIGNLLLKIFFGLLVDRIGGIKTAFINAIFVFVGVFGLLLLDSKAYILLVIASFFLGASYACANVISQGICADLFGKKNVGRTYATLSIGSIISSFSSTIFGLVYDFSNSYYYAIVIFLLIFIVGVVMLYFDYKIINKK